MRQKYGQIEHNHRALAQRADLKVGNMTILWLLRVPVGPHQAVVLFPKFSTYGIGFQHEEDWNTNLPSSCPAAQIYEHIRHNKGDRSIPRARCIAAIRALQEEIVRLTGDVRYRPVVLPDGTEVSPWDVVGSEV